MMGGHRIVVDGLTKKFGKFRALDNVSFNLEGGRTVGYLGPNGAGKTTTLKILAGLLRPSSGRTLIDGMDVRRDRKAVLSQVGAIIETPEPYPQLTGFEALEVAGEFRGVRGSDLTERVRYFTERLELPDLTRRVGKLSKGQRQRVVIAATLLADPPVLLLDEPTSGLDPAERVRIRNTILELKRDHLILMSSHLLTEVAEVCDDVVFINNGRIILQDTVERVTSRIRVRQVEVEFAQPVAAERLTALVPLVTQFEAMGNRRFRFTFDGTDENRVHILERCMTLGPVLTYVGSGSALEDVYLQLMGASGLHESGPSLRPPPPPPPPPR